MKKNEKTKSLKMKNELCVKKVEYSNYVAWNFIVFSDVTGDIKMYQIMYKYANLSRVMRKSVFFSQYAQISFFVSLHR